MYKERDTEPGPYIKDRPERVSGPGRLLAKPTVGFRFLIWLMVLRGSPKKCVIHDLTMLLASHPGRSTGQI